MADGSKQLTNECATLTLTARSDIGALSLEITANRAQLLDNVDLILGMDFLHTTDPATLWKRRSVHINGHTLYGSSRNAKQDVYEEDTEMTSFTTRQTATNPAGLSRQSHRWIPRRQRHDANNHS